MRNVFIVCFILFAGVANATPFAHNAANMVNPFIYGGRTVKDSNAPWQAVIYLANEGASSGMLCGATVIAPNWVITAAHCFYNSAGNRIPNSLLGLAMDTLALSGQKLRLPFDEPIVFDGYTPGVWDKDIALVRLRKPISGNVRPIVLASTEDEKVAPPTFFVTGWGETETQVVSDNLLYATLKPVSISDCAKDYPTGLTNRTMCAGAPPNDACHGDSGGPLYSGTGETAVQFGIVVAGNGCGRKPGVYVRVSQFRDWIETTIAATGDKLAISKHVCTPKEELQHMC